MNEEKIKQILNKIGEGNVPPDAALIAERASRSFSAVLKIPQPKQWFLTPVRLMAAAAVIVFAFAAGRWSRQMPPASQSSELVVYAQAASTDSVSQRNPDSFWQQKALAARQPRRYVQTSFNRTELTNAYKQYLKKQTF
jgi:hypothetical protein